MTVIGHDDAGAEIAPDPPASGTELAVWTLVVLLATALPPFGIIIAAVLAFTRLRHNRVARWLILGLSIAIIAFALLGVLASSPRGLDVEVGPAQPVN